MSEQAPIGWQGGIEDWERVPLFQGLDAACRDRLAGHGEVRLYSKRKLLLKEGAAPDCLFVLLEGMVELFGSAGKRDAAVAILLPYETFMPAAALFDEPYLVSARALTPVRVLALDAAAVRKEVRRSPQLARRFTQILAAHFRMSVRHIKDLKLRTGPERLGALLLRIVDEMGKQGCADLPLTKGTLAARLGLTAESVSRAIPVLRDQGLLVRGRRVILTDREKIERFCAPDPLIDGGETELLVTAV